MKKNQWKRATGEQTGRPELSQVYEKKRDLTLNGGKFDFALHHNLWREISKGL